MTSSASACTTRGTTMASAATRTIQLNDDLRSNGRRRCTIRFPSFETPLPTQVRNRGCATKSWTKYAEFRRYLNLDGGAADLRRLNARPHILLNHELSPCELRTTTAFRHQFIESSAFDHMSAVEHQDARGIANGR